jgi:DNA-binding protein H-NS
VRKADLASRSVDELWSLYEQVSCTLAEKILAAKAGLEERLRKIAATSTPVRPTTNVGRRRRPYPKVHPKYQNPENRGETWAGRGKQPRWLVAQLRAGKKLEDFQMRRAIRTQQP